MATEEPPFTVVTQAGDIELRDYPPLVAAEVIVAGSHRAAGNQGFRLLAGYIFGGNRARESLAMTAPVVQAPAGETIAMTAPVVQSGSDQGWTVRFIMPRGRSLESLPVPNDARVKLLALPATRVAVVRFSGLAGADDVTTQTERLRAFIQAHGLAASGGASLARYNPPWTPWFMRRNEVMIPVRVAAPERDLPSQ